MINILLLNWNSSDDIQICINQIIKSNFNQYRLILIDNNSNQIDKDELILFYNKFRLELKNEIYLMKNYENFGYAGGNNRGYEYLRQNNLDGDILILNPDVLISENTLEQLKIVLDSDNTIGAVMCRTVNDNEKILYDYIAMNGLEQKWLVSDRDFVETDYVVGSCMLLRREVIDKIGLFNEKFFMYWEEVDLSFRIKELGFKLFSTTQTTITRKDNDKSRSHNMNFYMTRNVFLIKKHHAHITFKDLIILLLKMLKGSIVNSYKYRDIKYLLVFIKGVFSGIKTSIKI